jgi:hypothetical protein
MERGLRTSVGCVQSDGRGCRGSCCCSGKPLARPVSLCSPHQGKGASVRFTLATGAAIRRPLREQVPEGPRARAMRRRRTGLHVRCGGAAYG